MAIAVKEGRATRPKLEVGICGEHGGDPDSIHLCHKLGLNFVQPVPGPGRAAGGRASCDRRHNLHQLTPSPLPFGGAISKADPARACAQGQREGR